MHLLRAAAHATLEKLMADQNDIGHRVMEIILRSPGCDMEDVVRECLDFTWNQVFLELDRMSRSGQVTLQHNTPGHYCVAPGKHVEARTH
jgi:hypothetical protein